ncbi:MAG: hypothetical protein LBE27_06350 [Deltaproteobacteria bacterium]|nr:hypothetical protein [Deltaproteobacteria bacterium]
MLFALILPLLAGALINLDRRAFAQTMVSRPLPTGAIVGYLAGLPLQGLSLGLWSELLWFWTLPVGGTHTPNPGIAVSAALISLKLFSFFPHRGIPLDALLPIAFLLVPIIGYSFILVDKLNRIQAERTLHGLEQALEGVSPPPEGISFFRANLQGLVQTFTASLAFLVLGSLLMYLVLSLFAITLPGTIWGTSLKFAPYAPLIPFLGIAASLSRGALPPYLLGLLTGLVALGLMRFFS